MYNLSHIYMTENITGSRNPYLLFGSLFPDFHQSGVLDHGFDVKVQELMQFFKDKHPNLLPLAVGMTLHEHPIDVDRFIHSEYDGDPGYAFQFTDQLFQPAKEVLGGDDQSVAVMTHFLVENAIEYKIAKEHPEIKQHLQECFDAVDKGQIITALSEFYRVTQEELDKEWDMFTHQAFDYNYADYIEQGRAWADVRKRLFDEIVDPNKIAGLIELASQAIAPTVDTFLADVIRVCKKDYEKNFPTMKNSF